MKAKSTESVTLMAARVPTDLSDFVYLAGAKLRRTKQEIVTEALRQYREYLVRTGVVTEEEANS